MASGGGGAWKVAYADFVTAMMAFFMVMWLTSQKPEVISAVAEHFRNPGGKRLTGNDSKSMLPSTSNGNGARRVTKVRGTKKSEGENKYLKMADEGDKSNVGTIVLFPLNSTELSDDGKEKLLYLIPELEGKQHRIEIRGHAASSGNTSQSSLDAWNISYKRAMSVTQYLVEQGIDPRRLRPSAAGNSDPRFIAEQVDLASDSRVEVYVLTEVFEEPSAKAERLVSGRILDAQAAEEGAKAKAAAAAVPAKGGH
ncbi:MAG: OmpA family protein [Planctomycetota bacterium]|nr:OmpA family protein [Planctomycetota bacterium]